MQSSVENPKEEFHRCLLLVYYLPLISNNPLLSPFPSKMSAIFEMIIEQQVRCLLTVRQLSVCAWGQSFVSFSCISRRARHLAARHSSHGASPIFCQQIHSSPTPSPPVIHTSLERRQVFIFPGRAKQPTTPVRGPPSRCVNHVHLRAGRHVQAGIARMRTHLSRLPRCSPPGGAGAAYSFLADGQKSCLRLAHRTCSSHHDWSRR